MRGKNAAPVHHGSVQLLEGIKRIEEKRFRRACEGLQIDPVVGNVQMIARARNGNFQLLSFTRFPKLKFLVDEEQHFRRRAGDIRKIFDLPRRI